MDSAPFGIFLEKKWMGELLLVDACPVNSPVGNNTLSLALFDLKRADAAKPHRSTYRRLTRDG